MKAAFDKKLPSYEPSRRLLVICVFELIVICRLAAASHLQAQVVSARAGRVCHVQGEVLYHGHEDKGVRPLEVGTVIDRGDIVFTISDGRVEWSLTPDSYLRAEGNSQIEVSETSLHKMRFAVIRGEVLITLRSLEKGASLEINTPPALITISKAGVYRILVAADGETDADVGRGELRYVDRRGRPGKVKEGRRVHFYKVENGSGPAKSGEDRTRP